MIIIMYEKEDNLNNSLSDLAPSLNIPVLYIK